MKIDDISLSKRISFLLRHGAVREHVPIDEQGWVFVSDLLAWLNREGNRRVDAAAIARIVETNDKQRFELAGDKIRAVQGHSIAVDPDLQPATPPAILFHGTATRFVPAILSKGLLKMGRQHVHLSATADTALLVGKRHGQPAVFQVDAAAMARDGFTFYLSKNGVWLVDHVPSTYLSRVP
jgi:putative RNA 2'-phosphotransferase